MSYILFFTEPFYLVQKPRNVLNSILLRKSSKFHKQPKQQCHYICKKSGTMLSGLYCTLGVKRYSAFVILWFQTRKKPLQCCIGFCGPDYNFASLNLGIHNTYTTMRFPFRYQSFCHGKGCTFWTELNWFSLYFMNWT